MSESQGVNGGPSPKLRYVSTSVIANRLGISRRTIRSWAECGEIPASKFGRQWRIEETEFTEWLSRRRRNMGKD
jgi:excisionase family DNA binding protein